MSRTFASSIFAPVWEKFHKYLYTKCRILLLGLDSAGKTTILYNLKLNAFVRAIPTNGFNVESIRYKSTEFTIWDIGGCIRSHWRHYIKGTDAVIYVVDASDRDRIDEAARELKVYFQHQELKNAKLLVYANKWDKLDCMSLSELRDKLTLSSVTNNPTHVVPCIGKTGEGLKEGLEWLNNVFLPASE